VVKLLIVDDEAALLSLLQRYLTRLGYEVESAANAEDALALFASDPARYDCVLTDLKLPGMGGEELIERIRELRPGLPALISSGYPYQPRSAYVAFLQKPYLPAMLAGELEALLKKRTRGATLET
jgi:DNA-binding NtrC family response regulator